MIKKNKMGEQSVSQQRRIEKISRELEGRGLLPKADQQRLEKMLSENDRKYSRTVCSLTVPGYH